MTATTVRRGSSVEPARASFVVPWVVAIFVGAVSLTLLTIGARSPYTHANLLPSRSQAYERTEQISVGGAVPYGGPGAASAPSGDAAAVGAQLYVTKGCVACHALEGRGGVVGPAIVGTDVETLRKKTQTGPGGMPTFATSALTDEELRAISAYLGSLVKPEGK